MENVVPSKAIFQSHKGDMIADACDEIGCESK